MNKFIYSTILFFCCLINPISSIVQLKSNSHSFPISPAGFARGLNGRAICGSLHVADPLDACSSLLNEVDYSDSEGEPIVLIVRGRCSFEDKVRNAQDAGFRAAIVYNDRQHHSLISMSGNPEGIWIFAAFASNEAGEILKRHAQAVGFECCIISLLDDTAWTVLVISFISVLAVVSLLFTFFLVYNQNRQQKRPVMDDKVVDNLPCTTFGSGDDIGETCAICLEDYKHGENLKVLPCQHDFHALCICSWLKKWSTFCPICKHDVRTKTSYSVT